MATHSRAQNPPWQGAGKQASCSLTSATYSQTPEEGEGIGREGAEGKAWWPEIWPEGV